MVEKIKIGVLACGRGTNLEVIINRCLEGKINGKVIVVISYRKNARSLEIAKHYDIDAVYIDRSSFSSREEFDIAIAKCLKEREVDLVCLAGFFQLLGSSFVNMFRNRIMNIHPSLLPAFPGFNMYGKALDYGVKFSGCTVYFVDEGVDSGPIIAQAVVPVLDNDTEESLANRILEQEHIIYPKAIQLFATGRLKMVGRRVIYSEED